MPSTPRKFLTGNCWLKPGKPRHEQISDWLREQVQEGVYAADSQIPSESQLTERFDV
ncbi:MAG: GntR family transcriptional regulator, partial [Bacteroidetes bacterium]|nr:GntR family transcriptional regulator [Bacteroidota bacterium]